MFAATLTWNAWRGANQVLPQGLSTEMTVAAPSISTWAAHDMAHRRQIALMIQHYLAPKMGNTRNFSDVYMLLEVACRQVS